MSFLSDLTGVNIDLLNPSQAKAPIDPAQQAAFLQALQQQGVAQQGLIGQLQQQALGQGPNPAQVALQQATNRNIAQQAGAMASQKGINPGLAQRQVAQQGANLSQQAAGQGAQMQAQQQLASQQALQNALMGQAQTALGGMGLNQQANLYNAQMANQMKGQLLGGLGTAGMMALAAKGGMATQTPAGPQMIQEGGVVPGKAQVKGDSLKNDTVPAMLSAGEIVIPRSIVHGKNPGEEAKKFVEELLKKKSVESKDHFADGGMTLDQALQPNFNLPTDFIPTEASRYTGPRTQDIPESGFAGKALEEDIKARQQYRSQFAPSPLMTPEETPITQAAQAAFPGVEVPKESDQIDYTKQLAQATLPQQVSQQIFQDPFGYGAYSEALKGGYGSMMGAASQQAKAMGALGEEKAKGIQEYEKAIAPEMENYETQRQDLLKQRQDLLNQYKEGKIDPNHYWNSKTTSGKIGTALGLILGGIGSGMSGKSNMAMDFINKSIENDINSQYADLGKKRTLLSENLQELGNIKDAMNMTRLMAGDKLQHDLMLAEANAVGPIEKARAQQAIAQLKVQMAPIQQQLETSKALTKMQTGQAAVNSSDALMSQLRMMDPKRAEELEKRYIPGIGFGTVSVTPEIRKEIAGRNELNEGLNKLMAFARKHEGSLNPKIINEGEALASQVQDAYRRANAQGVFKESEAGFVKGIIAEDPTAFFANFRTLPKYKSAMQMNKAALNSTLTSHGFKPVLDLSQYERPMK